MKKKMNYSYKEHEFGCFLYEVTETFVQFLENITMFCKNFLEI